MPFLSLSTAVTAMVAFTATVDALPQQPGATSLSTLAKKMPANTLPAPTGLELKYVLLGVGTQNYTCLTGDASDVLDTTGATAKLYDLGTRLNNDPLAQWKIPATFGLVLSFSAFGTGQLDLYLRAEGYNQWLGNHFFTLKAPTFSLYKTKATPQPLVMVSKRADQDAPKTACQGTKGEGAVKWLYLTDDAGPALSQGGVNTVYRIVTAGGNKPATCQGQKKYFEMPYAAQY